MSDQDSRKSPVLTIDHESNVPVYVQLAEILRAQIASGELQPHRPVPSERTLTQRYEVSDGTVKRAMSVLREAGLVETVRGKGIYVTGSQGNLGARES